MSGTLRGRAPPRWKRPVVPAASRRMPGSGVQRARVFRRRASGQHAVHVLRTERRVRIVSAVAPTATGAFPSAAVAVALATGRRTATGTGAAAVAAAAVAGPADGPLVPKNGVQWYQMLWEWQPLMSVGTNNGWLRSRRQLLHVLHHNKLQHRYVWSLRRFERCRVKLRNRWLPNGRPCQMLRLLHSLSTAAAAAASTAAAASQRRAKAAAVAAVAAATAAAAPSAAAHRGLPRRGFFPRRRRARPARCATSLSAARAAPTAFGTCRHAPPATPTFRLSPTPPVKI